MLLLSVLSLSLSCTKTSYKNYTCECRLDEEEGGKEYKEYGVHATIYYDAASQCDDIEERVLKDNIEKGFDTKVTCSIK